MTDEELTLALAKEVVRIGEENADFVYKQTIGVCHYYPNEGNPNGCIMGYAARNIGHPLDHAAGNILDVLHAYVFEDGKFMRSEADPDTERLLHEIEDVQFAQDRGKFWGEAVIPLAEALAEIGTAVPPGDE